METIFKSYALTKKYGSNAAVDKADMTIHRGDVYGFIGGNGAGKTTVIRMICGLAAPTSGSFELFGVKNDTRGIIGARRRSSAIVEAPSVYTNMTARQNFEEQCRILGIKADRYDELIRTVGLGKIADSKRKAGNFSLGMKQRLGIAMALAGSPEFIILDEPLNGLDPQGFIDTRELILKLNRENNITFLISSHILSELSLIATHYGFISEGKLIKEISASDLHAQCRESIDLELENQEAALEFISRKMNLSDAAIHGNKLRIFDDVNVGELVSLLCGAGYRVNSVHNHDGNLEEFYLKVIGGRGNA